MSHETASPDPISAGLADMVQASLVQAVTKERLNALIDKHVEKILKDAIESALNTWSETGKTIQAAVKDALRVDHLDLPAYGHTVCEILHRQIDARVSEVVAGKLATDMDDLLKLAPKRVKLSEVVASLLEKQDDDPCGCDGPPSVHMEIEWTDYGSARVYLSEEKPRDNWDAGDRITRRHNNVYRVIRWDETAQAVTGGGGPSSGGQSVADPRVEKAGNHTSKMAVAAWERPARTVTTSDRVGSGAQSVGDPRVGALASDRSGYRTQGHYGVLRWTDAAGAVTGSACHDNGSHSVADPRPLPGPREVLDPPPVIFALDGTWHRPFTTLELAALQGLPVERLAAEPLDGASHSGWRERIGNAVPPLSFAAIASEMGRTLLLAWSGVGMMLDAAPVWVQPVAASLSIAFPEEW